MPLNFQWNETKAGTRSHRRRALSCLKNGPKGLKTGDEGLIGSGTW